MSRIHISGHRHQSNAFAQWKLASTQKRLSRLLDQPSIDDHDPRPEEYGDELDISLEILPL